MLAEETLDRAELVPGGGASAWGNSALGGVIQLLTDPVSGERTRFAASQGDFSTRSAEFEVTRPAGRGTLQILGDDFSTSGFPLVAPERRGPVDLAAWSHHDWLSARWRLPLGNDLEATITARTFHETRGNGTAYTGPLVISAGDLSSPAVISTDLAKSDFAFYDAGFNNSFAVTGGQASAFNFAIIDAGNNALAGAEDATNAHWTLTAAAVPEPATYLLMAGGLAAIGFVSRRRRQA